MGKQKYFTEEERKKAKRVANKRWRDNHKAERAEYNAKYKQEHKAEIAEYKAKYYQQNRDKIRAQQAKCYQYNKEYFSEYYQTNKEKIAAQQAEYYQANKEKIVAHRVKYYQTPMGRAVGLLSRYKSSDKNQNRGECTLTAEWVIQNIFSKPCNYCGETDWHLLGCDRIDNSLPHTPENCVPCCDKCNRKRGTTTYEEFMKQVNKVKGDN